MADQGTSGSRLLHVVPKPSTGGCESLALQVAEEFSRQGWTSDAVFLESGEGATRSAFTRLNIPVHTCAYDARRPFDFIRRMASLCRSRRPRALICYAFGIHFFIALGARLGGVRHVLVHMGNPPPGDRNLRWKASVLAHLSRPFVEREFACSHYVAAEAKRTYRLPSDRIAVVWNCCNVEEIAARSERSRRLRQPCGPVIGMVARLDAIKDHETLLRAFALFARRYDSAELRLIGDGPSRPVLQELCHRLGMDEHIRFLGARDDVPEQLGELDIFVFSTTRHEGFGIALAEAMAAGLPIVASDVGPCREILSDGGRLVAPRDPQALADAIEALWTDGCARTSLGRRAAQLASERYSPQHAVARLVQLIQRQ